MYIIFIIYKHGSNICRQGGRTSDREVPLHTISLTPDFWNLAKFFPESPVPGREVTGAINDDNSCPSNKGFYSKRG